MADFAMDLIGLAFGATAWVIILFIPIEFFVLPVVSDRFAVPVLARVLAATFGVLLGLFLKWVGNGIQQRKRGRLLTGCILCLLFAALQILSAFALRNPYAVAQSLLLTALFLASSVCLFVGLYQERALG